MRGGSTTRNRLRGPLAFKERNGAIWVIAHRLAGVLWKILHNGVRYIEQGDETNPRAKKRRAQKLAQALRKLGYAVTQSRCARDGSG
jgi:hypothetical protein